ncbi:MAG: hypothetical protein AAFY65_13365 [Pseudomonadota bacterium]
MRLSLRSNIRAFERDLSDAGRKQLPFAVSLALNETAKDVQKNETRRLSKVLDRPTQFTKRAYAIRRATKRRLEARVFAKRIQAAYLRRLEEGGTAKPRRRAIVTPQRMRTNRYGNLPRGAVRRSLAKPNTFSSANRRGPGGPGVFQRLRSGKVRKLVSYIRSATYRPQLGFRSSAAKTATRRFPVHLDRALRRAFRTRR